MFVAKHIKTGLYYKRGNYRSKFGSKLVTIDKATMYRSKGGLIKSVGNWTPITGEPEFVGGRRIYGINTLDETKWEIVPTKVSVVEEIK